MAMTIWKNEGCAQEKLKCIGSTAIETKYAVHDIRLWSSTDELGKEYYITCSSTIGKDSKSVLESVNPCGHFIDVNDSDRVVAEYVEYADRVCRVMREEFSKYLDSNEKRKEA